MRTISTAVVGALAVFFAGCASSTHGAGAGAPSKGQVGSTLDPRAQRIAQEELERTVAEWQPTAAVVIVLDPATGAVLAMAGRDHGRDEPDLGARRAWVTGSTLKTFTIAAALDARTIELDSKFDCATRFYGADRFYDGDEHGVLSVSEVLSVSSNVGASRIYDTLGLDRLTAALRQLHIGDPPGTIPVVTDPGGIKAATLASGELAEATPLQVAAGYAAIVNDGVYVAPSLHGTSPVRERAFRSETAHEMIAMLEATVTSENGKGRLARVEGARVAGKTGTSGESVIYASFVGTVLDREPRFVALVGLEAPRDGGYGPTAAAPAFARLARRLINR